MATRCRLSEQPESNDLGSPGEAAGQKACLQDVSRYYDTSKGRRPSWNAAAPGEVAAPLVQSVVDALRSHGADVATGEFGAHMHVELTNDGPVTLVIDV